MKLQVLIILGLIGFSPQYSVAEEVKVAVVMAFYETLLQLKPLFEKETGHHLIIIADSAGALFQKIKTDTTIDVFLSGDVKRPKELINQGFGLPESFQVYALGRLVLWTKLMEHLRLNERSLMEFKSLAVSDPENTPYGHAAREVLVGLNLWENLQPKIQMMKTTADAYQAILSHQTEAGFISLAQYLSSVDNLGTQYWMVPQYLHSPLNHGAVILRETSHLEGAQALLKFLRHPSALKVIREFGFRVPDITESSDD